MCIIDKRLYLTGLEFKALSSYTKWYFKRCNHSTRTELVSSLPKVQSAVVWIATVLFFHVRRFYFLDGTCNILVITICKWKCFCFALLVFFEAATRHYGESFQKIKYFKVCNKNCGYFRGLSSCQIHLRSKKSCIGGFSSPKISTREFQDKHNLNLWPRLRTCGKIFERTKTCEDPPSVYTGPTELC